MMLKWSHATDITNMGQINYYFLQCNKCYLEPYLVVSVMGVFRNKLVYMVFSLHSRVKVILVVYWNMNNI